MYRDWRQVLGLFLFMSASDKNWCSNVFAANMVNNIIHSMQVLNIQFLYRYSGTIRYPCYHMLWRQWRHRLEVEYSHKDQFMPIFVAIVLVWIATNQTIRTNVKKSCLIIVIVKKMSHATGTSAVLSAPSTFPQSIVSIPIELCSGHQPTKLVILHCFIK